MYWSMIKPSWLVLLWTADIASIFCHLGICHASIRIWQNSAVFFNINCIHFEPFALWNMRKSTNQLLYPKYWGKKRNVQNHQVVLTITVGSYPLLTTRIPYKTLLKSTSSACNGMTCMTSPALAAGECAARTRWVRWCPSRFPPPVIRDSRGRSATARWTQTVSYEQNSINPGNLWIQSWFQWVKIGWNHLLGNHFPGSPMDFHPIFMVKPAWKPPINGGFSIARLGTTKE